MSNLKSFSFHLAKLHSLLIATVFSGMGCNTSYIKGGSKKLEFQSGLRLTASVERWMPNVFQMYTQHCSLLITMGKWGEGSVSI